jgi:LacI family transcriptional regulator
MKIKKGYGNSKSFLQYMSITGKELAAILGVSEATISMALNGKSGVSDKKRKEILEAAQKHGYDFSKIDEDDYRVSSIAFIIYKRSGAVVSDTPFFSQLTEGISNACKRFRSNMRIFYIYENEDVSKIIKDIRTNYCEGIILLATEMSQNSIRPFVESGIPIVVLDAYFETIAANYVLINNVQGAYIATEYLIYACKSQPGYLKSSYAISNFLERGDGFYKALRTYGMSAAKTIVHELTPSIEGAYAEMKQIIKNKDDIARCYFADNDMLAIGAMQALIDSGYKVPEDVSIVGFDDISFCKTTRPTLTTVKVPKEFMGKTAVERLFQMIRNPEKEYIKMELSTEMEIRKSVVMRKSKI